MFCPASADTRHRQAHRRNDDDLQDVRAGRLGRERCRAECDEEGQSPSGRGAGRHLDGCGKSEEERPLYMRAVGNETTAPWMPCIPARNTTMPMIAAMLCVPSVASAAPSRHSGHRPQRRSAADRGQRFRHLPARCTPQVRDDRAMIALEDEERRRIEDQPDEGYAHRSQARRHRVGRHPIRRNSAGSKETRRAEHQRAGDDHQQGRPATWRPSVVAAPDELRDQVDAAIDNPGRSRTSENITGRIATPPRPAAPPSLRPEGFDNPDKPTEAFAATIGTASVQERTEDVFQESTLRDATLFAYSCDYA